MATRTVRFNLRKIAGAAAAPGAKVKVRLKRNTYTGAGGPQTFDAGEAEAEAGPDGVAAMTLWTNADAAKPVSYVCELESGQCFPFDLPAGAGPVDVEALRLAGELPAAPTSAELLLQLIEAVVGPPLAALAAALAPHVVLLDTSAGAALAPGASLRAVVLLDTSAGDVTVGLPPLADSAGLEVTVKKISDENTGVVDGDGAELIDGALVYNLEMLNEFVTLAAAAGQWRVTGKG